MMAIERTPLAIQFSRAGVEVAKITNALRAVHLSQTSPKWSGSCSIGQALSLSPLAKHFGVSEEPDRQTPPKKPPPNHRKKREKS
jgi:hypothetical protein